MKNSRQTNKNKILVLYNCTNTTRAEGNTRTCLCDETSKDEEVENDVKHDQGVKGGLKEMSEETRSSYYFF